MAKKREGKGFPMVGDRVLAEDGSTWLYEQSDGDRDPEWTQQDPSLSVDELDDAQAAQKAVTDRLSIDHRVYSLAFAAVRGVVKRETDLQDTDPKEQFVLALATSRMRDSILEASTGQRSDLEQGTLARLRSFLGDPELATAQAELERLRRHVSDEAAPDSVVAKARGPMSELAELASKLPMESDARKTITTIATSRTAHPELADRLFRELVSVGVDVEQAKAAHGAATAVARAYG